MKVITTILGLAVVSGAALAKEATADLKVPDMSCGACAVAIKQGLRQTNGVKNVDLNLEKRTAKIVYEDTQVTEAQIQKAIEKAGFKSERAR
jgi:copper chaperone CopZ